MKEEDVKKNNLCNYYTDYFFIIVVCCNLLHFLEIDIGNIFTIISALWSICTRLSLLCSGSLLLSLSIVQVLGGSLQYIVQFGRSGIDTGNILSFVSFF